MRAVPRFCTSPVAPGIRWTKPRPSVPTLGWFGAQPDGVVSVRPTHRLPNDAAARGDACTYIVLLIASNVRLPRPLGRLVTNVPCLPSGLIRPCADDEKCRPWPLTEILNDMLTAG